MSIPKKKKAMLMLLPEEIITDIFLRLPAKPLLRFRCISKSLCAVIDDPYFIKLHLNRSVETKTHQRLIIWGCPPGTVDIDLAYPTDFYAVDFDDGLNEAVKLNNPLKSFSELTEIFGSCNGLLLLLQNDETLALWNPFTRRYKKLPVFPIKFSRDDFGDSVSFGLWHDNSTDDYRVVGIPFRSNQVWVFSLRTNSWRRVQDFPSKKYYFPRAAGKLSNAALYWMCFRGLFLEKIAAFDIANEKFHIMPLPDFPIDDANYGVLDGRLWTSKVSLTRNKLTKIQFYVSDSDGVGLTWSKLCPVIPIKFRCYYLEPLAYPKDGNKILMEGIREIFWYNLNKNADGKKSLERVKIRSMPEWVGSSICWESLVSLGGNSEFDGLN